MANESSWRAAWAGHNLLPAAAAATFLPQTVNSIRPHPSQAGREAGPSRKEAREEGCPSQQHPTSSLWMNSVAYCNLHMADQNRKERNAISESMDRVAPPPQAHVTRWAQTIRGRRFPLPSDWTSQMSHHTGAAPWWVWWQDPHTHKHMWAHGYQWQKSYITSVGRWPEWCFLSESTKQTYSLPPKNKREWRWPNTINLLLIRVPDFPVMSMLGFIIMALLVWYLGSLFGNTISTRWILIQYFMDYPSTWACLLLIQDMDQRPSGVYDSQATHNLGLVKLTMNTW